MQHSLPTSQTEKKKKNQTDGNLKSYNIFNEMVGAFYVAIDKANVKNAAIAIRETTWPTNENYVVDPSLVAAYNINFKNHIT